MKNNIAHLPEIVETNRALLEIKEPLTKETVETQNPLPDLIEVTISEVDRQTADDFPSIYKCICCTALMNNGYNINYLGPSMGNIGGERYKCEPELTADYLRRDPYATVAPFYGPGVVGKVIRLRRRKP